MEGLLAQFLGKFFDLWYALTGRKGQEKVELDGFYCQIKVLLDTSKEYIPKLIVTVNKLMDDKFSDKNDAKIFIPPQITTESLASSLKTVSIKLTSAQHRGIHGLNAIVGFYSSHLHLIQKTETRDFEAANNCLNALLAIFYTSSRMYELKERYFIDGIEPSQLRDKVLLALNYKIQKDKRPYIASV